jgi:hypothetical protein
MSSGGVAFCAFRKKERKSIVTPREFLINLVMMAKIKHSFF